MIKRLIPRLKSRLALFLLLAIIALGFGAYYISTSQDLKKNIASGKSVKQQKINIDKSFDIPTGLEVKEEGSSLKVTIQTAQLTNRIFISKKPKYARPGTMYLMLNFLIENGNNKRLNFKSRDIIRLIDQNEKKFAPSFYNKATTLEADSTKKDVVGFLVPDNIKEFKIQYGSLTGEKKLLELKFN